ncbi:NUDIX hydrolase [Candidatus Bipolaricaulota bacterium]|jgi:ADP-ribose pyrophosphatase YjhB (NUDIX family)|nr:NUDIX hydrolase [Candidatus Bipolaricaulota bacterium]TFH08961.1 MAG: NUDIX hydrolase [Candidatus Atribacteria bacterium]
MTQRYYIESDGRIYLVNRDGCLDLPTREEISFRFDSIARLATPDDVMYCAPILDAHPADWMSKDAVPTDPRVTPLVRAAVHATMPRVVSEGVYVKDGLVLLLKGSRGLTKDRWTLPGGFVRFGEGPVEGLQREIREELGASATIGELLAVRSKLGQHTQLHWTQFFYRVDIVGEIRPDPDEIAEARFFEPTDAAQLLSDLLMREVIESLIPEAG